MKFSLLFSVLLAISASLSAADPKIAIVDLSEVEDIVKVRVLALPQNVEVKARITEISNKITNIQSKMSEAVNNKDSPESKAAMKEFSELHSERSEAEKEVESQIKGEILRAVKEVSKDKYIVVLSSDYYKNAIITKNAEIVDLSVDVKEYLLLKQ